MTDPRAQRILFDTYWSSKGWKREISISAEDFSYAKYCGVMFDPVQFSHDGSVCELPSTFRAANLELIRNAFLVSLRTRQLEFRSALGSYAFARNFPTHQFQGPVYCCSICGMAVQTNKPLDISILNFERFKWGGVRHTNPEYAAFDLAQFASLDAVKPERQDFDLLHQILEMVQRCKPDAKPRDLEKRLAGIVKSNKAEREILLQILAYCCILQPLGWIGYLKSFPKYVERTVPPVNKIDWT